MISAWWLLLIVPGALTLGALVMACLGGNPREDE